MVSHAEAGVLSNRLVAAPLFISGHQKSLMSSFSLISATACLSLILSHMVVTRRARLRGMLPECRPSKWGSL